MHGHATEQQSQFSLLYSQDGQPKLVQEMHSIAFSFQKYCQMKNLNIVGVSATK